MPKDVSAQHFWARAQFFLFRGLAAFHRNSARQAALLQGFVGLAQRRLTECEVVLSLSFCGSGGHFRDCRLASVVVMRSNWETVAYARTISLRGSALS